MSASGVAEFAGVGRRVPDAVGDEREVRWIKRERETLVWSEWDARRGFRIVVKLYRRRGLFAYARMLIGRFRAEREYLVLKHLEANAVPCTPPLGWSHGYCAGHGFHEALVTRELVGMRNLEDWWEDPARNGAPPPDLSALHGILRRMHACGVYHGVLKLSNVLIGAEAAQEPAFSLLDMDMARVFPRDLYGTWVGRLDLREMCSYQRKRFGDAALRNWLPSYGLGADEIEPFLEKLAIYTRFSRQRRRYYRVFVHMAARAPALAGLARRSA